MNWVPDLRQLRAFVAVAEEGSFTLAARRNFVTQSAISHSLRALEEQLSCRLLERGGKKVTVTPEGELLLKRCLRVMHELDQVVCDLDGLRRWGQAHIRIGAPHSLCHHLIPTVLREFRDCFPRCEPVVQAGETPVLIERLDHSELDLVLGIRNGIPDQGRHRLLFRDRLVMVAAPSHPWVVDPAKVDLSDDPQPFIVYSKSTETHRLIEQWLESRCSRPRKPLVLGDMQSIKEMAKLGIGIGIVAPWVAAKEIADGSLKVLSIDGPKIEREWAVFHPNQRKPSQVEETFIGLCEMAFADLASGIED